MLGWPYCLRTCVDRPVSGRQVWLAGTCEREAAYLVVAVARSKRETETKMGTGPTVPLKGHPGVYSLPRGPVSYRFQYLHKTMCDSGCGGHSDLHDSSYQAVSSYQTDRASALGWSQLVFQPWRQPTTDPDQGAAEV